MAQNEEAANADPLDSSLMPGEKAESPDCADVRRWPYILAVSIAFIVLGWALLMTLRPALTVTLGRL
jgi:hypothetical protein